MKYNKIITLTLSVLIISLLLLNTVSAYDFFSLAQGETHTIGNTEITLVNLGNDTARYSVNGELTPNIGFFSFSEINDGILWSIEREDSAAFVSFWPDKEISSIYPLSLSEGSTDSFSLDGFNYEVTLLDLSNNEARLSINGENTGHLGNYGFYEIDKGVFWVFIENSSVKVSFLSYPICQNDNCEPLNCDELDSNYIDSCSGGGACFDKYTGVFQGCGPYDDCEINNDHADRNVFCSITTNKCSDSDGGKDYYVKGKTTVTTSSGFGSNEDRCEYDKLYETYCGNDNTVKVEHYDCPNGCEDGACKISYDDETVSLEGTLVKDGKSYDLLFDNSGSDGNLLTISYDGREQTFALSNNLEGVWHTNGIEVPVIIDLSDYVITFRFFDKPITVTLHPRESDPCMDSDSNNIYTRGTVNYNNLKYNDLCYNDLKVKEFICVNDKLKSNIIDCSNGCENGACKAVDSNEIFFNQPKKVFEGKTYTFGSGNDEFGFLITSVGDESCNINIKFPGSTTYNKQNKLYEGQSRTLNYDSSALIVTEVFDNGCDLLIVNENADLVDTDNSVFTTSNDGLRGYFYPGDDIYTKGYIVFKDENVLRDSCVIPVTYSDGVNNGLLRYEYVDESDKLMEQMLVNGLPRESPGPFTCPNGCKDGACIKNNTLPEPDKDGWFSEGETRVFSLKNHDYKVTLIFVSEEQAKFSVNGQISPSLNKGSVFESEGFTLTLIDIHDNKVKIILSSNDIIPQPVTYCDGCTKETNCLPIGTRVANGEAKYCDYTKELILQKIDGSVCQNNYECVSNQCLNAKCVSLEKQVEETKGIIEAFIEFVKNIFG